MGEVASRYKIESLHVIIRVIREGVLHLIQIYIVFGWFSCWLHFISVYTRKVITDQIVL